MEQRPEHSTTKLIILIIGLVILALFLVYTAIRLIDIIMLLYLSVVLALFFTIFVDFMERKLRVPRVVGLILAFLAITGVIALFIALVLPPFLSQGKQLISNLPRYLNDLDASADSLANKHPVLRPILGSESLFEPTAILGEGIGDLLPKGMGFFLQGIGGLITLVAVIIIAFYIVLKPGEHKEGLLRLFPSNRRNAAREIIDRIVYTIRRWMIGQAASMFIIAVLSMFGYWIAGIKFAFFFGILTGVLCFIPYLGPVLSLIGPVLVSLIDDPIKVIWVFIVYLVTQGIESYFLTPLIMKKQVDLPPVLTIIAVIAMGHLMGVIGIALAVPTVAIAMVIIKETYLKRIEETQSPNESV